MPIKFISRQAVSRKLKSSVHTSGKLGFTKTTIEELNLRPGMALLLGVDEDEPTPMRLYMKILEEPTEDAFIISKAGDYYSASTKDFFDHVGLDFRNTTIIYDMRKIEIDNEHYLEMTGREVKSKGKGTSEGTEAL